MSSEPIRVLSFDLEDWFHLIDSDTGDRVERWDGLESRVVPVTRQLLDALDEHGRRATFFCLGWVAERHPTLVGEIARRGHELGSHSYAHRDVAAMTPAEWARDLDRSIAAIEAAAQRRVACYRAPGFSVRRGCEWVFEGLLERGIAVDCSLSPGVHAHGGYPLQVRNRPLTVITARGAVRELPMSVFGVRGLSVPLTGGGYFRLAPRWLVQRALAGDYCMTYFHPRDFDVGQPVQRGLSALRSFRAYVGIRGALEKLRYVLARHEFVTVAEAVARIPWARQPELRLT
jgi:polysaccharide deacetylase family protein (PEP-CTERM system associated)